MRNGVEKSNVWIGEIFGKERELKLSGRSLEFFFYDCIDMTCHNIFTTKLKKKNTVRTSEFRYINVHLTYNN